MSVFKNIYLILLLLRIAEQNLCWKAFVLCLCSKNLQNDMAWKNPEYCFFFFVVHLTSYGILKYLLFCNVKDWCLCYVFVRTLKVTNFSW